MIAPDKAVAEISAEQFHKWCLGNDVWALAVLKCFNMEVVADPHIPELSHLLEEYKDIFGEPQSLPPPRVHDHTIPLKPSCQCKAL